MAIKVLRRFSARLSSSARLVRLRFPVIPQLAPRCALHSVRYITTTTFITDSLCLTSPQLTSANSYLYSTSGRDSVAPSREARYSGLGGQHPFGALARLVHSLSFFPQGSVARYPLENP